MPSSLRSVPRPVRRPAFAALAFAACGGALVAGCSVEGYTPEWPGMDQYQGTIVHPQTWPEDLDYKGKKVICIGSGATTATVVPAIAADCDHVTVLQRSPTYFWTGRNANELADTQLRPPANFSGTMQSTGSLRTSDNKIADRQTLRLQWSQAQHKPQRSLEPDDIATMITRGHALLENGDIAESRYTSYCDMVNGIEEESPYRLD